MVRTLLYAVLLIPTALLAFAKGPAAPLALPDGFIEFRNSDGHGTALVGSKIDRQWRNVQGIAIRFWTDDSCPVTNADISNYAPDLIEQIKKQTKHGTLGSLLHYTVAGKNWIAVTFHQAPEADRDLVVLVTQFKQSAATIQVTARQTDYAALKTVCARIIELNRP